MSKKHKIKNILKTAAPITKIILLPITQAPYAQFAELTCYINSSFFCIFFDNVILSPSLIYSDLFEQNNKIKMFPNFFWSLTVKSYAVDLEVLYNLAWIVISH